MRSGSIFAGAVIGALLAISSVSDASRAAEPTPPARAIDFDAAMRGLNFDPGKADGNADLKGGGNGLLDADEMALVGEILADPKLDLRGSGGVDHKTVWEAFQQAQSSASNDMKRLASAYPTGATVAAGYAMLGEASFNAFGAMTASFGAPLKGDYAQALKLDRFLGPDGDADGDGVTNRAEYAASKAAGRSAYVKAALDPAIKIAGSAAAPVPAAKKVIGVVLYPGFEVLDVFGPVEMWANVPDFQVVMIAQTAGPVRSAQGVQVTAEYDFATAPALDVMMVPGGVGTYAELQNPAFLEFLRSRDQQTQLTTSVCTGSALLAKAGLLKGRKATSNKLFFTLATQQDASVAWQKRARWVEDGKYLTSSGVSAGTDMALGLIARIHGKDQARRLARTLEYQWNEDPANDPFAIP